MLSLNYGIKGWRVQLTPLHLYFVFLLTEPNHLPFLYQGTESEEVSCTASGGTLRVQQILCGVDPT